MSPLLGDQKTIAPSIMRQKVLVRPTRRAPGIEHLTPLDQYMVRVIIPELLIFQVDSPKLRPAILENLQTGLAYTIDELPFLAASIVPESEERETIKLEYDSEESGVWFYWQEFPEVNYHALAKRNFPFSTLPVTQYVPDPLGHSKKSPVMTVMVTFITGGAIVTFSGHHAVMDAQGMGTLVQTWSKNVNAVSEGRKTLPEERVSGETLDGTSIFGAASSRPLSDYPTFWAAEKRPYEATQAEIMRAAIFGDHKKTTKMVPISHWFLSQEALDSIKADVVEAFPDDAAVTQNSLITALIWRHVSLARQLTSKRVTTSSALTSVNVRRRMDPPLPIEYPGNGIVLARATADPAELESTEETNTLYNLARKIGDSIDWWTPEEIWQLTGSIDACKYVGHWGMIPPLDYDVLVTSPARLGDVLREAEWGRELGPLKALRFCFPAFMDGFATTLPGLHGGVDIMIWVSPETQLRLRENQGWTKWVKLIE